MQTTVIIAEKPEVARSIAAVVGANEKHSGYLQNSKGTCVTWAYGHLARLAEPARYGWEKWSMEDIPMIPDQFMVEPAGEDQRKKQFEIVVDLFKKADRIIEATDAGREGELIFRYIYYLSGCNKPFERLWISSLTEDAIFQGLKNLKSGKQYDNLYSAGKARGEADWLIGMNYTRLMTLKAGYKQMFSIGRVQTPTLGLIVTRYRENKNFVPQPFYVPTLKLKKDGVEFTARYFDRLLSPDQAEMELLKIEEQVKCVRANVRQTKENPPKLYDLTLLQRECNRFFKFSAQHTLDVAQALYEKHKVISYPRTDSNYLTDDFEPILKGYFRFVGEKVGNLKKACERLQTEPISKLYIDSNKVGDHHAIIPIINAGADYSKLSEDERTVFFLVATRFVCSFMGPCERREQELLFVDEKEFYKTTHKEILKMGWREVSGKGEEEEKNGAILPVVENDAAVVLEKFTEEGKTTKPPLLTEDTLLELMEKAGRKIEDENLRIEMKSVGLGTPATRARIIELLFERKYIEKQKSYLLPTAKGEELFDIVKDLAVSKVDLTAEWERRLADVEKGILPYETFMKDMKAFTIETINELKKADIKVLSGSDKNTYGFCPVCGKPLFILKAGVGCSGWKKDDPQSCRFFISRTICQATLSDAELKRLADGKTTSKEYSMVSKAGNQFSAKIEIKEGRPNFIFSDNKKKIGRHEKKE